jgi:N-acetylmuramic acid 6-phosphate etherase
MLDHLQTEARNPSSTGLDELTALEIVRLMSAEDATVAPAVAAQAEPIARAIDLIADRLRRGGRLVYAGAGTSGRLGVLDATECPPTFSSPPGQVIGVIAGGPRALTQAVEGAEDHPEFAERDLAAIGLAATDVLVGIATSGRTPYVLGAVAHARRQGAATVGLSCNPDSEVAAAADLAITVVVGPEVLSGSTRLKAGTATKLVLNMLSTGAMVRLGKTFGNLMVDLRATNAKLRARTNRIVRQLTGLSADEADALLRRCDGELKTALVAQLANLPPDEARTRLQETGGQVRRALAAPPAAVAAHDLLLGVDGGGSRTVALLARLDGVVIGRGEAGPSNPQAVGVEAALRAIDVAVGRAFTVAGRPRGEVAAACLGLAGVGRPDDERPIREWAERHRLASVVEVTSDVSLLLAAGTPDGWGVALVAGTGSIALARDRDGRTARAGGWGHLLDDAGSGYALALAGLRAVVRAADGRGPATALSERLLERLGLSRPQELVGAVYRGGLDRTALAALAPLVLDAAEAGDTVAADLVEQGASELALMTAAAARPLSLGGDPVPLALAGGLLLGSDGYRGQLLRALERVGFRADPVAQVHEPAKGALRRACANARRG